MNIADYLAVLVRAQLENKQPCALPAGVTIEQLDDIALHNHMDYLILGSLLRLDGVAEEWIVKFRGRVLDSVMRTATQVTELKELIRQFEERQIVNQPMKGSCLKFIYPSPEMREMSDIDILVREDCMEEAGKVLQKMGYTLLKSIKHHDIYVKGRYMVLEIHRAMYDKTVDRNQYEYFSDLSKAVLREGCCYTYDFKAEDFYVYMLAHMAKHFYKMGCGIRNLIDIYIFRKKYDMVMDQQYIQNELEKCGLQFFAGYMERLAEIWLGNAEWDEFSEQLFTYMMGSGIYGKDENGIWSKFTEENMQEKDATVHHLKSWYYFPPLHYMSEYYPWLEQKPFLLPVAWGIRFWRGVFKKKGIHKREMLENMDSEKVKVYQEIYRKMHLHFKR